MQINNREIFKRTGIPELDEAIKKIIAPKIAIGISFLVESSVYQNFNNETKVKILKKQIEKINKEAGEKNKKKF